MIDNLTLKTLRVRNFKNHKDLKISFADHTEIYGGNAKGKTSVMEAIIFSMFPSKFDVSKIKLGEEKAQVDFTADVDGEELEISSWIDKDKKLRRKLLFGGIAPQNPSAFLKNLLACGTFNPRDMVEKKGRQERLLKLLPLTVKKEDFANFPIHQPREIKWDEHAFVVLAAIDKDLRNTKRNLYQKKDLLLKSYQKNDADLAKRKLQYTDNYKGEVDFDEVMKDQGKLEQKKSQAEDNLTTLELEKTKEMRIQQSCKENIERKQKEVVAARQKIKELEREICLQKDTAEKCVKNLNEKLIPLIEKNKAVCDEFEANRLKLREQVIQAKEKQAIENLGKDIEKQKNEALKAEEEHDEMWRIIREDFPSARAKILAPLKDIIKGFDMDEEGNITIEGKSIDELSGSESVQLGIKFMEIEKKSKLYVVDEAECLDEENLGKIKWPKNTIVIRVAGKPIGGDFKSIKLD